MDIKAIKAGLEKVREILLEKEGVTRPFYKLVSGTDKKTKNVMIFVWFGFFNANQKVPAFLEVGSFKSEVEASKKITELINSKINRIKEPYKIKSQDGFNFIARPFKREGSKTVKKPSNFNLADLEG